MLTAGRGPLRRTGAVLVAIRAHAGGFHGQALQRPDGILDFGMFMLNLVQCRVILFFNDAPEGSAMSSMDGGEPAVATA